MALTFAAADDTATPLTLLDPATFEAWRETLPAPARAWVAAQGFSAAAGQAIAIPSDTGIASAALGLGKEEARLRKRDGALAGLSQLPRGVYRLANRPDDIDLDYFCLAWLLAAYRFDRYAEQSALGVDLIAPQGIDAHRIETIAAGEALTRDLINTPASDMGPHELEEATRALAGEFDADIEVTADAALLERNFPMIHAVGRASARRPRLIDMTWGKTGPSLTLVGKGVCFDTGGLNIKPGGSMGLMKKDMGGAANVLGLARMIMGLALPLRLRVLIPAVENSIGDSAFRPQDILTSRKGLTVEINNTDAEGRLVLADALALAEESAPDLLISMATLTGAARVAVGPDIAPFFTDHADLAQAIEAAGEAAQDPVWRLPLHPAYEAMIEPGIADLDNAPSGGFAGAITAALFLRRFASDAPRYAHF
ncbi:MAG: leucyl aminopeptidase family protein, partial [Pseudomonadota bacterium]